MLRNVQQRLHMICEKEKKSKSKLFHEFGCKYYIFNDYNHHENFDSKSDFLGYSESSTTFRIYNIRTCAVVEESVNVVFNDYSFTKYNGASSNSDT